MINLTIKENLIKEASLSDKLKDKIVQYFSFVITDTGEIYLPDVNNEERWVMFFRSTGLGVFVYTSFEELIDDLVYRDIQPEQIAVLRDDEIEININVGK